MCLEYFWNRAFWLYRWLVCMALVHGKKIVLFYKRYFHFFSGLHFIIFTGCVNVHLPKATQTLMPCLQ